MATTAPRSTRPLRVHLENLSTKDPVFALTDSLVRRTRSLHPDLRASVRFSVGNDLEKIERSLASADVLVTSTDVIRHPRFPKARLADAAPSLRMIHLIGAGIEGALPLDWLPARTKLTNNSGVHAAKVTEFMLMALLALNNRLPEIVTNQRAARWTQPFTPLIRGRQVTVVGLGDMGRGAVRAARMLGMTVTGVRRTGGTMAGVERIHPPAQLKRAVAGADFVVIATPLTPRTRGLFDATVLDAMKPGAGLINVGRGAVLDDVALAERLRDGRIGGAILDVFDPEPLPQASPLWSTRNLIVHPHCSSDDSANYMIDTMGLVCSNLRRLIAGRPLRNVVLADRGY